MHGSASSQSEFAEHSLSLELSASPPLSVAESADGVAPGSSLLHAPTAIADTHKTA